jgi:hypothetical protein
MATTSTLAWILAGLSALAFTVAVARPIRLPVWTSMLVALVLRVVFAAITSQRFTPNDVRLYFRQTALLVARGQDPVRHMPGREWNFLPLMPYVHLLELKTGLPWVYAVKIAPIAADVIIVWLVSRLARSGGESRALQYALNPVSLFVVSLHGQVEPIALALGLGGMLLAARGRWFGGGLLLGAAIAAKTWPALLVLAILPLAELRRDFRLLVRLLAGTAVVPLAVLGSGMILLDSQLSELAHVVTYTSYVGYWGWASLLQLNGVPGIVGMASRVGRLGSLLTAAAAAAVVVLLRRLDMQGRSLAVLSVFLIVTAGFGTQYLLWPVPLLIALGSWSRIPYALVAGGYAAVTYLIALPHDYHYPLPQIVILSALAIVALIGVLVDVTQQQRSAALAPGTGPAWRLPPGMIVS